MLDDRGRPLDGVVVSAMGGSTSFAVSDRVGQFTLRSLTPGPYLVRAHREGYLPARNTMVNVRPSSRTVSTFTLRRVGASDAPHVAAAGVGVTEVTAIPADGDRDESETAWRLRHLKRSILKDAVTRAEIPAEDDFFLTDSLQFLGRAMESSARMAGALFPSPLQGQVNLLTTGVFETPGQILRARTHARRGLLLTWGALGGHGDWAVKAALNQGDLSSWILAGNYVTRSPARHQYQFGMSYGLHRYEGGNPAALAAMPDAARNVGAVYAHDEWNLSERLTIGYGGPLRTLRLSAGAGAPQPAADRDAPSSERSHAHSRCRGAARRRSWGRGILAAARRARPAAAANLCAAHAFRFPPEDMRHYEVIVEQLLDGATVGVRTFYQTIDDQLVTVFGLREAASGTADLGHYAVGSGGDVDVMGVGITYTHALADNVRGSIDYSVAAADWANQPSRDRLHLARTVPGALREDGERIHDITTTLETAFPQSDTRIFLLYKMNSAYVRDDQLSPGLDARWDVQVTQGLPFMSFTNAEWEMLVGVRNLFREAFTETSVYDELLVVRPPKRLVGGITVRF